MALGMLYHSDTPLLQRGRPFTVLTFLLLNLWVHRYYRAVPLVRFALHRHFWKTCTLALAGIIANDVHELMFRDFHLHGTWYNVGLSALYVLIHLVVGYYFRSDSGTLYVHVAFLFFPIKRVWQVNLYIYVLFVTVAIFLIYSKCTPRSLVDEQIKYRPLLKFFPYLRLHDMFIWVGILQLFLEYRNRYIPDTASAAEIERIIDETNKALENENV
jgi:hypothetical protein